VSVRSHNLLSLRAAASILIYLSNKSALVDASRVRGASQVKDPFAIKNELYLNIQKLKTQKLLPKYPSRLLRRALTFILSYQIMNVAFA